MELFFSHTTYMSLEGISPKKLVGFLIAGTIRGLLPVLLLAGLISLGRISVAHAQEVRGTHVVDIPAGAYQAGAYQAGADHYVSANIAVPAVPLIAPHETLK